VARRLAVALVVAAAFAGSAFAGANEPQKRYNAADQAWARAIRIHRADLPGGGWKASRSDDESGGGPKGCKTPKLSDLVATGDAGDIDFGRGGSLVTSGATAFATERAATAA
jgi:hypothetical protein